MTPADPARRTRMLRRDIWRLGLVTAPIQVVVAAGGLEAFPIRWAPPGPEPDLPGGSVRAVAGRDPQRLRRSLRLPHPPRHHRRAALRRRPAVAGPTDRPLGAVAPLLSLRLRGGRRDLDAAGGAPVGTLSLYRAKTFPDAWEKVASFALDTPAIDATPFRRDGRWWLAYAPSGSQAMKQSHLHLAFADRLTGPWTPHPGNPCASTAPAAGPAARRSRMATER